MERAHMQRSGSYALVERNRPATFTHPWWSFVSDFRMLFTWLGGGLPASNNRPASHG
jgi:hypothetical protein